MLKKMMLLAMAVGALVAFAVPASASAADVWTAEDETLGVGEKAEQSFEGSLQFTTPFIPNVVPQHTTYQCTVTVRIRAEGPAGGTVTEFKPTTDTCSGTGLLLGAQLTEDFSNIAEGWEIDVSTTPATVRREGGGDITIRNVYCSPFGESHLTFGVVNVTPTLNGTGTIEHLSISGTATNTITTVSGSVTPDPNPKPTDVLLGIEAL